MPSSLDAVSMKKLHLFQSKNSMFDYVESLGDGNSIHQILLIHFTAIPTLPLEHKIFQTDEEEKNAFIFYISYFKRPQYIYIFF